MPPKKKGGKKANDDWEAELGESIAPPTEGAVAPADGNDDAGADEDAAPAGGLMARMKKAKEKRAKKGIVDDFVEGETAPGADDIAAKAPEEATMDDEFALPGKKGKGGKQQKGGANKAADADDEQEGGKVLTKAEKERIKKEKEKARKKEQVSTR